MRPWMTFGAVLGTEKRQFLQKNIIVEQAITHDVSNSFIDH